MKTDPKELLNAVSLGKPLSVVSSSLIQAGMDFWMRSVDIGARHFARAVSTAVAPSMDTTGSDNAVDAMIEIYRQYLTEMVSAPGAAVHRFREELAEPSGERLLFTADAFDTEKLYGAENIEVLAKHGIVLPPEDGKAPATIRQIKRGSRWVIDEPAPGRRFHLIKRKVSGEAEGKEVFCLYGRQDGDLYKVGKTQYRLPARVQDASQGFAVYRVSRDVVQDLLDGAAIVKQSDCSFRAWDIGGDETPIALFMVDYRQSDLGAYREFGIACFIAPQKDPLALGMHLLALYVDDQQSCDAGNQIWGYPKRKAARIEMDYKDVAVTCALYGDSDRSAIVTLRVPRGGSGTSRDIPLTSYTLRLPKQDAAFLRKKPAPKQDTELLRTVFTRSGRGEMLRSNPKGVDLQYSGASTEYIVEVMQSLGLVSTNAVPPAGDADDKDAALQPSQPMLTAWTEHMSGEFGVPGLAKLPVVGDD